MGLSNSDYIAISALVFTFINFIYFWNRTRTKGAKMAIYGVKHINNSLATSGATYTITIERFVRNVGDTREHLIYEPEIIVFDIDGKKLVDTKKLEERHPITPGSPDYVHVSFVCARKAESWHNGEVSFNAYYHDKKGKKAYLKKDSFPIQNIDVI